MSQNSHWIALGIDGEIDFPMLELAAGVLGFRRQTLSMLKSDIPAFSFGEVTFPVLELDISAFFGGELAFSMFKHKVPAALILDELTFEFDTIGNVFFGELSLSTSETISSLTLGRTGATVLCLFELVTTFFFGELLKGC